MTTKTLVVEWMFEGFRGDVLYWRCGRCEQDFMAPGDVNYSQFIYFGVAPEPRCWCGAAPEIVLHGLGTTGWTPRLPGWAADPAARPTSGIIFRLRARDVRLDQ